MKYFGGLLFLLLTILVGCGQQDKKSEKASPEIQKQATAIPRPPTNLNVELDVNVALDNSHKLNVEVSTNIPDGANFFITATNAGTEQSYSSEEVVTNGKIGPVLLGPDDGLPPGNYEVEVMMPNPGVQPAAVQKLIGSSGELLKGPFVVNSDMGFAHIEHIVSIPVGSQEQIQERELQAARKRQEVWRRMKSFVTAGRSMEKYRGKVTPDCIDNLRRNHEKIKALREEVFALPVTPQVGDWRYAIGLLLDCNNCTSGALKWCNEVDSILDVSKP